MLASTRERIEAALALLDVVSDALEESGAGKIQLGFEDHTGGQQVTPLADVVGAAISALEGVEEGIEDESETAPPTLRLLRPGE